MHDKLRPEKRNKRRRRIDFDCVTILYNRRLG